MTRTIECVTGIDLGSTTTKAVVLDDEGRVLGRGITNSRSNYDVACQVAWGEAMIHAKFALLRRELLAAGAAASAADARLSTFGAAFKEQQYRGQLTALQDELAAQAERTGASRAVGAALSAIATHMDAETAALFAPGAERKSDFFRDLAGSRYLALASEVAAPFDVLAGLFDKAILVVENSTAAVGSFAQHAHAALLASTADAALEGAVERALATELVQIASVGTGYGRQRLPFEDGKIRSEILCHGLGAHHAFPRTRTVLDIGGQDTKAIQVDEDGVVTSFQMNDRCAAGCGRYLGYIADEMNLGVHEIGPLAQRATRRVRINSTCTVFAGAELRERLSLGEQREDILAGLHRAIILRAMSLLARSGGVHEQLTFTGGVARNVQAVAALRALVAESYGERTLNISSDSIYTGALGAALFAWRDVARHTAEVTA